MKNNNLNIPAILIKNINGKEKQLSGKLVSINESSKTCKMVFGTKSLDNIPLKHVLINEGFLDKVKEYGKKIVDYVKKTVKGFFVLVDEATGKFLTWSTLTVANTAKMAAAGKLPNGIYFAPSSAMAQSTGVNGLSIDDAMAEAMNNDRVMIEKFWRRVIKRAGTTNEPIEESVKFVNESFYKINPAYKKLNEAAMYTLDDIKSDEGVGGYGTIVDAKQLKNRLIQNIRKQISGKPGKHADAPAPLVWGAPGIGKTAIINSTIKEMANRKIGAVNLSLITIMLAGYTIENWTLPSINSKGGEQKLIPQETERFTDCPKTWLPVYLKTSNPEEEARRDHYCNTGEYRGEKYSSDGRIYEGGIVFMDEYSRTVPNVQNIIMGLINEHKFGDDYVVASKWGFVFAANRSYDDNQSDLDDLRYYPVAAQNNRFIQYTYVPKKADWLEWATSIDPITHRANVPPFITEFIAQAPEHVWYSTVANGGYDDILNKYYNGDKGQINSMKNNKMNSYDAMLNIDSLKMTKRLITPRTWANFIGPAFENQLITLLEGNSEGISGEEMYQKLIDKSVVSKTDKDGTSYKEYYGGILPNILIDALNDIDADYWEEEYEIMGGDNELDPAHTLNGKSGRYQKLMAWLRRQLIEYTADSEETSPLIKSYDDYNSYAKYMTDDVINSIWENGSVPAEYQEDDDYKPLNGIAGYNNTEYAKWKSQSAYLKDVLLNKVLPAYPGNIETDMQDDINAMKNPLPGKEESEQLWKELHDKASFTIKEDGKKPEVKSFFFNEGDDVKDGKTARLFVKSYRDSKVFRKLLNVITWAAKIAYQTGEKKQLNDMKEAITNMLHDNADTDTFNKFMKQEEILKAKQAAGKTYATDPTYKATQNSVPLAPILHMFTTADNMFRKDLRNRKQA